MKPPLLTRTTWDTRRKLGERGDVNLIALAVGLPVVLLIITAAFDIMRVPMMEQALMHSLHEAAFDTVPNWNCDDPNYPCEVPADPAQTDPIRFGIEPFFPTAFKNTDPQLLNTLILGCQGSVSDEGIISGSSTSLISSSIADAIYSRLRGALSQKAALAALDPSSLLVVSVSVEEANVGSGSNNLPVLSYSSTPLSANFFPDKATFDGLAALLGVNAGSVSQEIATSIQDGAARLYPCVGKCEIGDYTGLAGMTTPVQWLAKQRWVVIVAYVKITSVFGKFSLIGGNVPAEPGSYLIVGHVVRPFGQLMGLQC